MEISGYTKYPRQNFYGFDMGKIITNSRAIDCAKFCERKTNCMGFVVNFYKNLCYLKYKVEISGWSFDESKDTDLYIKGI